MTRYSINAFEPMQTVIFFLNYISDWTKLIDDTGNLLDIGAHQLSNVHRTQTNRKTIDVFHAF